MKNYKKKYLTRTNYYIGEKANVKYICRNNLLIYNIFNKDIISDVERPDFFSVLSSKKINLSETSIYSLVLEGILDDDFKQYINKYPVSLKNSHYPDATYCKDNVPSKTSVFHREIDDRMIDLISDYPMTFRFRRDCRPHFIIKDGVYEYDNNFSVEFSMVWDGYTEEKPNQIGFTYYAPYAVNPDRPGGDFSEDSTITYNRPKTISIPLQEPNTHIPDLVPEGRVDNCYQPCFIGMVVDVLDAPIPDSEEFITLE